MTVVQELERRFLPLLYSMAKEIEAEFPNIKTNVWSTPVGSLTEYQGHDIGIECLLPNAGPDQSDNIALTIELKHITSKPEIDSVDVCWGHPVAHIEAELFPNVVEFSNERLNEIESNLLKLFDKLKVAIKRGNPPDE